MTTEAHYRRDAAIYEGAPLSPQRLAAIWRQLPERERFGFVLSLTEDLADQVIILTHEATQEGMGNDRRR